MTKPPRSLHEIMRCTALVHRFMEIHDDWFTIPKNSMYEAEPLVSAFLLRWARTGVFPDDWNDSRLIYVEGKFREWLAVAPKQMYLICTN